MELKTEELKQIAGSFMDEASITEIRAHGNGHINDTFVVVCEGESGTTKWILQKINKYVFPHPEQVMENVVAVTSFLKEKIIKQGGNPERETLTVLPAKDGKMYCVDERGDYWRCYNFISDTLCFETAETVEDFYEAAVAFGKFQSMLADYPAETLHETIANFHNTKARFAVFQEAVAKDTAKRAKSVQKEIQFILDREAVANYFTDLLVQGEIPLRVTHNDTKINNILMDKETRKGTCVIDLDTVMPGLAMHDFGDAVRFGASTAAEDETDLSKVSCDLSLFEVYTKGFIEGCGGRLTPKEIKLLPMGAKTITLELGMRFLTDYLNGDVYFKVHRDGHNLDRCRTQLKLVADMEDKWDKLQEIVAKYM